MIRRPSCPIASALVAAALLTAPDMAATSADCPAPPLGSFGNCWVNDLATLGSFAYSATSAGFEVWDLSVCEMPRHVATLPTPMEAISVRSDGGRADVASIDGKVFTFDISDPVNPWLLRELPPAPLPYRYLTAR